MSALRSVVDTCQCVGSFCRCNGAEVLKDGARMRVSPMMRDGAISGEKHVFADTAISDSDRAYAAMVERDGNAWRGSGSGSASTVADEALTVGDRLAAETKEVHDHTFALAREAGLNDGEARAYAAREEMKHRDANAWRTR